MQLKKNIFVLSMALFVTLSLLSPTFVNADSLVGIRTDKNIISLSDSQEIKIEVDFGYQPDINKLEWSLGGKGFSEWKKFNVESGKFDGENLITFVEGPSIVGNTVKATIKFEIAYDMSDSSSTWGFVYSYWDLVGPQALIVTDTAKDNIVKSILDVKIYESYHTYDEIKPAIDKIIDNSNSNRYVEYMSNGKSVEGRDLHFVIIAKDEASVNKYLDETKPMMLEKPEALRDKLREDDMGDYKLPLYFSNIHPNEVPATDALLELFEDLATEEKITYDLYEFAHIPPEGDQAGKHVIDENKSMKEIVLDVDELLDDVIVLINFTTNPDGRYHNARVNANGFDLNRDCSFQTQPESKHAMGALTKWRPTIFLEYHGFYKECVIAPPTTAPHDPNVEYDLLLDNNLKLAQTIGIAGISNSPYEEFQIPYTDLKDGWDDLAPNYTDYFAQSLGTIGSIIEIPDLNQASVDLLKYASYGALDFLSSNKDELFENQLEVYLRGVNGLDDKKVDSYFTDENNKEIGRPRGENENFFPEYYVIPVDGNLQKNALEAHRMAERLMNSGVSVDKLTETVKVGKNSYPKGSYIVNMHQATRAVANNYLYDGLDVSKYGGIYSENVISMHNTLGFDRYEIREAGAFDNKLEKVDEVLIPKTDMTGIKNSQTYIIKNNNNHAIMAVNRLLDQGKKVEMFTKNTGNTNSGDFIVSKVDLALVKDDYLLNIETYAGKGNQGHKVELKKAIITALPSSARGDGSLAYVLRELGFHVTDDAAASNIIVSQGAQDVSKEIIKGKSYVGIGREAMSFIKDSKLLAGFDFVRPVRNSSEALVKANIIQNNPITGPYDTNESIYIVRGGYITGLPKGAKVLTSVSEDDDFFIAGYWQENDMLKGQDLSFSTDLGKSKITVFANDIAFRSIIQSNWRMLANSIFTSVSQ